MPARRAAELSSARIVNEGVVTAIGARFSQLANPLFYTANVGRAEALRYTIAINGGPLSPVRIVTA
jgi:hypothetical protein